jgi:hypothetical protein
LADLKVAARHDVAVVADEAVDEGLLFSGEGLQSGGVYLLYSRLLHLKICKR